MPTIWERLRGAGRALFGLRPEPRMGRPARMTTYPPGTAMRNDLNQWAGGVVEKIRVATLGGHLRFLPWHDPYTEESPEIRAAYPTMLREPTIKAGFLTKVLSVCQLPAPLRVVRLTDREPWRHDGDGRFWWEVREHFPSSVGARSTLPKVLLELLEASNFDTREAALDALSTACLTWANRRLTPVPV